MRGNKLVFLVICMTLVIRSSFVFGVRNVFSDEEKASYNISVNNSIGATYWFCNNTPVKKGDSVNFSYTVESVETFESVDENVFVGFASNGTKNEIYPVPGVNCTDFVRLKINESEVNYSNYPLLPNVITTVGTIYSLDFKPIDDGTYYRYLLKANGTEVDSGRLKYAEFFGINTYCYRYKIMLKNATCTVNEKDYGFYSWARSDGTMTSSIEQFKTLKQIINVEDNYTVNGAETCIDQDGYAGCDALKIVATGDRISISFALDEIQSRKLYSDVHVSLRLKIEGEKNSYSALELYKAGEEYIDGDLPKDVWNRIEFDTKVFKLNGKKTVRFDIMSALGETIYLSYIRTENAYNQTFTLNGAQLFQMECDDELSSAYLLITKNNKIIAVDSGNSALSQNLYKTIINYGIKVDYWLISHYHADHTGGLIDILNKQENPIIVDNLVYDFPDEEYTHQSCEKGSPDIDCIGDLDNAVNSSGKVNNVIKPKRGDVFTVDGITIKVLNDSNKIDYGSNFGNETTVVYKVETGGDNILFLGDLGESGDSLMKDDYFCSEAVDTTIVQMAHHGQNGTTKDFYGKLVNMKMCLYPSAWWIYNNDDGGGVNSATLDTLNIRNFIRELGIMYSYSCEFGRVRIA